MHFPPKFLQNAPPPTFSMVHLLHRLYGVDARGRDLVKIVSEMHQHFI